MSQYSAPNLTIKGSDGTSYAYRRFGKQARFRVVFLQHFRSNLDSRDPALIDEMAAEREAVLVDNSGSARERHSPAVVYECPRRSSSTHSG